MKTRGNYSKLKNSLIKGWSNLAFKLLSEGDCGWGWLYFGSPEDAVLGTCVYVVFTYMYYYYKHVYLYTHT